MVDPADTPVPVSPPPAAQPPVSAALVVYALYALAAAVSLVSAGLHTAPLWSIVGAIGLVIAYVKLSDARGTWVESHLRYLIRTFWWGLGLSLLGWVLVVTIILIPLSFLIWVGTAIWIIYRIVRGYLWFKDSKPVPA
jgi:uncharacterized membrane protein